MNAVVRIGWTTLASACRAQPARPDPRPTDDGEIRPLSRFRPTGESVVPPGSSRGPTPGWAHANERDASGASLSFQHLVASRLLFDREILARDRLAVQRDLDLVVPGREPFRLADHEGGGLRTHRIEDLAVLMHGLAFLVCPLRRQRGVTAADRLDRGVNTVLRREAGRRGADHVVGIDAGTDLDGTEPHRGAGAGGRHGCGRRRWRSGRRCRHGRRGRGRAGRGHGRVRRGRFVALAAGAQRDGGGHGGGKHQGLSSHFHGNLTGFGIVRNPRDRVGLDSIRLGKPVATGIQDGLPRIRIAAETRGDFRRAAAARHDAMGGRVDCGTGLSPQVAEIRLRRRTRRAEIHVPRTAEKSGLSMSWPIARLAVPERGSVIARGWLTACECLRRPFSCYAVEHVVPGQGKTLRDLMTDACHQVHERSAAQSPAGHEVIYAQLAAAGTVLGRITIDGARLTAEVKSRERADLLKDIIEDRLGAAATFRADEIQTPEQAMAEGSASPSPPRPQAAPETQAILADYLRSHYKRWPDMPLPALGNRTPREVVQTAAGREQVAALLFDAERYDQGLPATLHKSIFDPARRELGLKV